jgi:hypothetical protein
MLCLPKLNWMTRTEFRTSSQALSASRRRHERGDFVSAAIAKAYPV